MLYEIRVKGQGARTLSGTQALLSNRSRFGLVKNPVTTGVLLYIFKSILTDTEHRKQTDSYLTGLSLAGSCIRLDANTYRTGLVEK